jgi:hypothetical protein
MFAKQISSTKPTTPRNSSDVRCSSEPSTVSRSGSMATLRPSFVVGYSRARSAAIRVSSARAASSDTPGARRAMV